MPIKVEGFDEYIEQLVLTDKQLDRICGRSLHPGAKIVSDACKVKLQNLRTDDSWFGFGRKRLGPTKRQKMALIESMGIAKMRHRNGTYDVKLGFDGYNDIKSTTSKTGKQPNALIARSVNKGTSFMYKQPFMDQSISENEAQVIKTIEEQFEKELMKIFI